MIYKIIGKFESVDFGKLLTGLSKDFLCLYAQDVLYVAIKDYKTSCFSLDILKKKIKPAKLFYIENIDDNNIKKQNDGVQQWCLDNLKRLNAQKIEFEQQDKLREIWEKMDKMEEELQRKQKELQ